MPLLTQYRSFFISPFGESSVCDELNKFLSANRIINVDKRLIDGERGTGWLFLVEYGGSADSKFQAQSAAGRVDYREVLTEQEFALYEKLRLLRKEIAEAQKVPPYVVFNNEHLAAMSKSPPASLKDIAKIPGVGDAKIKQYGEQFLHFFAAHKAEIMQSSEAEKTSGKNDEAPEPAF